MKQKAFTLLETIIAFAIVIIFFVITIPLVSKLTESAKLSTAARNVASALRTARGGAISDNTEYCVQFDDSVTPSTYFIYWDVTGYGYGIPIDKIYQLPQGIWFYNPTGDGIEFTNEKACFKPTGELDENENKSVHIADGTTTSAKSKSITVERTTGRVKID